MIAGHDNLIKIFKRLAKNNELSHGYIFFGETKVGKYTFAKYLANFLEYGNFEEPASILTETLFVTPKPLKSENSIGIDAVREIKRFLYSKPVVSLRRVVIIDNAHNLTSQAQNAILKIAEEPPARGLLILILPNPEAVLGTLQSRFQKIYFPRASKQLVQDFLIKEMKVEAKEASALANLSFGHIGRAKEMLLNDEWSRIFKEVTKFMKSANGRGGALKKIVESENRDKLNLFAQELIACLSEDAEKNYITLGAILKRLTFMSQFNVNKRLQLEAGILWNI